MEQQKTVFSGMRPTARLQLGNLLGALDNWVKLQHNYRCFFCVVDLHALTTVYDDTPELQENTYQMVIDWLAAGLDPEKAVIFRQSDVKEHAELHLLLSMFTPLSWLERVPTYKDQIPHVEITREIARRFNCLYGTKFFPEPEVLLNKVKLLPGIDGRKMSKSYGNTINMSEPPDSVRKKVSRMITDPGRIRKNDPGNPDVCTVFAFHDVFSPDDVVKVAEVCRKGEIGCVQCKKMLADRLTAYLEPIYEKRLALEGRRDYIRDILRAGAKRATAVAGETMEQVRAAMNLNL